MFYTSHTVSGGGKNLHASNNCEGEIKSGLIRIMNLFLC